MGTRSETERIIKEAGLDRGRLHEVPKFSYNNILLNISKDFVINGDYHLSWNGRIKNLRIVKTDTESKNNWYHRLSGVISADEQVYLIFEVRKGYEPKYRVYEAYLSEIITLLDEMTELGEFYIVSEKYQWLICKTHENTVGCSGDIQF